MAKVPLVLHVDDSKMMLEMMKDIIVGSMKLDLLQATSGEECIRIASEHKPDIIFVDVLMEPIDGWETVRELKKSPSTKDIPVVMLTGQDKADSVGFANSIGVFDYMVKPPSEEKIAKIIKKLFGDSIFDDIAKDTGKEAH